MKNKIGLLLTLILMASAVLTALEARGAETDSIKIAALYNITGGMSSIDEPALNGAKLAAKLINRGGGLLGGRFLEIIPFDTKTDARNTIDSSLKAAGTDIAAGIGYGDSTYVLLAAPAFQSRGIPFVTSGATLPDLPERIGDCLFMAAFGDDAQAHAIADFAYKNLKARNVVVWTDSTMDFTKALSRYFKDYFAKLGGQVLHETFFNAGEKDYSKLVATLRTIKPQPDTIFISAIPFEAGLIVKQIRESGINTPIISGDGFDTDLIVTIPGKELAFNVYFTTHIFRGEKSKDVKDFIHAYTEEYGHAPENAFAALGFDTVKLLSESIRKAGTIEKKALIKTIGDTRGFKGITGKISFKNPQRPPDKPVSIIEVKKGEYEAVEIWRP
ncbi:MAG: ABC transporter substrate-binding protein [Proteobacteria bacterium]|nr:ABC transporter substrate-binding protein [Pseudomonadota bacterium]